MISAQKSHFVRQQPLSQIFELLSNLEGGKNSDNNSLSGIKLVSMKRLSEKGKRLCSHNLSAGCDNI